jgi:hypothetical protein
MKLIGVWYSLSASLSSVPNGIIAYKVSLKFIIGAYSVVPFFVNI